MDEETHMPNNPRSDGAEAYDPDNLIRYPYRGHTQGSGWKKEIAAWMIDRGRVAGVPETVELTVQFPRRQGSQETILKQGSLQRFVSGEPVERLEYEQMLELPPRQVQQIAVLDLILGNADRNWGNCFWDERTKTLIPIDHGFSLLDSLDWREDNQEPRSEMACHWGVLPQLKEPLPEDLAKWVLSLDADELADELRGKLAFPESNLRELKIRLTVFQKALHQGYSLAEIAPMLMLMNPECLIESCCTKAANDCKKLENQWNELPPKAAAQKRFEIYFNALQDYVDEALLELKRTGL